MHRLRDLLASIPKEHQFNKAPSGSHQVPLLGIEYSIDKLYDKKAIQVN